MSYQTQFTDPLKFLGAYVVNASISLGWGSEVSICHVDVVEDSDEGALFQPPALGSPCIFKAGECSFGGILQKYEYSEDASSGRRYSIDLQSPGTILNGVYLILDKFQGTIYTDDTNVANPTLKPVMTYGGKYPTNIINVFGYKENTAKGGKFGAADLNSAGYPVKNIIADIKLAMTDTQKGFGGKIYYSDAEYDLDLSDLQEAINFIPEYRIKGDFISINDLIADITRQALCDFTYTITGKSDSLGVIKPSGKPIIKVKILQRRTPPTPNLVKDIITNYKNQSDNNLISYKIGKEISDSITQQVLIGGPASRYWLADRSYILPIWGEIGTGLNKQYFYGNSIYEYSNPFSPIRITIDGGDTFGEGNFTYIDTNLLELRCAYSSREAWVAYHIINSFKTGLPGFVEGDFKIIGSDFRKLLEGSLSPADLMNTSLSHAQVLSSYMYGLDPLGDDFATYAQRKIDTRFNCLQEAANNYYGKQFLVAIPAEPGGIENNYRWINFDQKYESVWDIVDSAWAGDSALRDFPDLKFYNEDGRLKSIAIFPNYVNGDYSSLRNEYGRSPTYGTNYGIIKEAAVDTSWGIKWVNISNSSIDSNGNFRTDSAGNKINNNNTYGFVKVNIDSYPEIYDQYSTFYNGFNVLCNLLLGTNIFPSYHNMYGFEVFDFALRPSPIVPEYIGVPQQSSRYVWGPWYSFSSSNGQKGKVNITPEEKYTPETYGSVAKLNEAAVAFVNAELTQVSQDETGYLELAELPRYGIGDKFFGSGPYIKDISISVGSDGFKTTYNFQNWTKKFGQLAKYNIDQLNTARVNIFRFQKDLREAYRNPPGFPLGNLISKKEQKLPHINPSANNMIIGNFIGGLSKAINNPNNEYAEFSMGSSSTVAAMRSLGMDYMESFGVSMEQIYTPIFVYDQRRPEEVRRAFNRGNI